VFVVKSDSTVGRVPLVLGTRFADDVEVVEGLQPGMTVVSAGHQKLFDGGRVIPIPVLSAVPGGAQSGSQGGAPGGSQSGSQGGATSRAPGGAPDGAQGGTQSKVPVGDKPDSARVGGWRK